MAQINGTTIILDVDGNPVAMLTDTTLNIAQDLPDASNKDSGGWAEHINGQRSWDVSLDGHADMRNKENVETLYDLIANRSQVDIEVKTEVTGDVTFTGTASLADMSLGAPNEDVATVSGSLTGTGALSKSSVS